MYVYGYEKHIKYYGHTENNNEIGEYFEIWKIRR